jgi:hypothetical protein
VNFPFHTAPNGAATDFTFAEGPLFRFVSSSRSESRSFSISRSSPFSEDGLPQGWWARGAGLVEGCFVLCRALVVQR